MKSTNSKSVKNELKTKQLNPKLDNYSEHNIRLHKDLKDSSYSQSLKRIRKNLPKNKHRVFSSFIHAKGMDTFNDSVGNILARPRSILAGSLVALIGVIIGIYLAQYYGYSYNYLLLFLFFIFGYVIELIIELIVCFFIKTK